MPTPENKQLYQDVTRYIDTIYKKPSAYRSGAIVKEYKRRGGTYVEDNQPKNLERWFKEKWVDIGNKEYPVYRPSIRINKNTPLTINEIDPQQAKKQIKLKQIIKGESNLPKFEAKEEIISLYSNPETVLKNAKKYLGPNIPIYLSSKETKKYMIQNPITNKWVHFGQMGFQDFTKHLSDTKKNAYLKRSANIKGNWKDDKYSANNLSRSLLWA